MWSAELHSALLVPGVALRLLRVAFAGCSTMIEAGLLIFAYLLGSVPFGVLVSRARGVDIMAVGSGNIGATNVWRVLGPVPGAVVLTLDILKGVIPAAMGHYFLNDASWSFGLGMMAVVGHSLSPLLKFKGGKGIATGYGSLMGSNPLVGMIVLTVFGVVLAITRYVSLASICAVVALLISGFTLGLPPFVVTAYTLMGALIVWKHRENIVRLRNGTERKFDPKGKATAEEASDTPKSASNTPKESPSTPKGSSNTP